MGQLLGYTNASYVCYNERLVMKLHYQMVNGFASTSIHAAKTTSKGVVISAHPIDLKASSEDELKILLQSVLKDMSKHKPMHLSDCIVEYTTGRYEDLPFEEEVYYEDVSAEELLREIN